MPGGLAGLAHNAQRGSDSPSATNNDENAAAEEAKKAEQAAAAEAERMAAEQAAAEEAAKKEAEAKQLAVQAESAVQALENNQVTENIAPAQAAIANVADQGTKDRLTHRVGLVQNAITVREQQAEQARQAAAAEQARQAAAAQQAQQQQAFVTQPQQGGYRNCSEARAAGAAPLRRGQPGYSARLDRDGDGIACE